MLLLSVLTEHLITEHALEKEVHFGLVFWLYIFEARFGCHDVLILDNGPLNWRQRPDMTKAVDWDVKHQFI